ncbi:hypothetical protein GCM10023345_09590 [Acinetobacter kookii]
MTFWLEKATSEIITVIRIRVTVWLKGKSNIKASSTFQNLLFIMPLNGSLSGTFTINPTILVEFMKLPHIFS